MITMQMEGTDIVSKSLRNIGLSMRDKKVLIKDVIRPAAKVVNGVMQSKTPILQDGATFNIYRNGSIYAKINKGQLKKSVGIFSTAATRRYPALNIGPRYKGGSWKSPEKGGWFFYFVQLGVRGNNRVAPNTFIMDSYQATKNPAASIMTTNILKMLKRMNKVNGDHFEIV
jgi:hypothetical protein